MTVVARMHYLDGLSRIDIADQLGLSRFKVGRLLDGAREAGIVTITVRNPGDAPEDLARELEAAFSLRKAVVIEEHLGANDAALFGALSDAACALLAGTLRPGEVFGVAQTVSLLGVSRSAPAIPAGTVIQLTGAQSREDASDVIGSIRALTARSGGKAKVFYAPQVAADPEAHAYDLSQEDVRAAYGLIGEMAGWISGVRAWEPGLSATYDQLPRAIAEEAALAGAVGEVMGLPIAADGSTVHGRARDLILAPDVEEVRHARVRLGVAFNPERARGVTAVLRTRVLTDLVIHRALADRVLGR